MEQRAHAHNHAESIRAIVDGHECKSTRQPHPPHSRECQILKSRFRQRLLLTKLQLQLTHCGNVATSHVNVVVDAVATSQNKRVFDFPLSLSLSLSLSRPAALSKQLVPAAVFCNGWLWPKLPVRAVCCVCLLTLCVCVCVHAVHLLQSEEAFVWFAMLKI